MKDNNVEQVPNFEEEFGNIDIEIYNCGGLCSFYAEKGGIIVGFEKD